jgi:hypothetical protein
MRRHQEQLIRKVNEMTRRKNMLCSRNMLSVVICLVVASSGAFGATVVSSGQTIAFNTTAVTYTIDGGSPVAGIIENGAARFDFTGLDIQSGAVVTVTGTNPLLIVSDGDIVVNSLIDVSGKTTVLGAAGLAGPAGGNSGGVRAVNPGSTTANGKGFGPGGGGSGCALNAVVGGSTGSNRAGGGGAYGGNGGVNSRAYKSGGSADTWGGVAAVAYGTPQIYVLLGGSGGGGGKNTASSGGGGGAIGLTTTSGNITIGASGLVLSNGGDAVTDFTGYPGTDYRYGGGGGSGGSIRLDAGHGTVTISGSLSVCGGHGGCAAPAASDSGDIMGGGGAGGRIAVYTASGTYTGTIPTSAVAGGSGGHYIPPSANVGGPGATGTIVAYAGPMVMPGKASGATPADNDADVDIHNPALTWLRGDASATAWDVYFGSSAQSLQLVASVTSPASAAGELAVDTQYFWRVDEHNTYGTVAGSVWRFTTRGPICLTPPVGDANGDCYVNFLDSAILAQNWLACNRNPESSCWQ